MNTNTPNPTPTVIAPQTNNPPVKPLWVLEFERTRKDFTPTDPDHLFGPANLLAKKMVNMATKIKAGFKPGNKSTEKSKPILLYGPSGTGKSRIADMMVEKLITERVNLLKINGKNVNKEDVEDWFREAQTGSIFPGLVVKHIGEVDAASPDAKLLLLSFLEEIPSHWVILATTNVEISKADRFWSRWLSFHVPSPTEDIVVEQLIVLGINAQDARTIASECNGNLRSIIHEAAKYFETRAAEHE